MDEDKGTWAETAEEGIVPDELSGDDDAPEVGRTTGDDTPATEEGIDLERRRPGRRRHRRRPEAAGRRRADLKDVGATAAR